MCIDFFGVEVVVLLFELMYVVSCIRCRIVCLVVDYYVEVWFGIYGIDEWFGVDLGNDLG